MTADAGLITLFLLVFVDALGVPAPGDSALLVAGALAAEGKISLPGVVAVASVAALMGDSILYWVGRVGGRQLLLRDGRFEERRRSALAKADTFYARYGLMAVYLGKFIPGVRGVATFAAGASGMRWAAFFVIDLAACLSWTGVIVAAGFIAGPVVVVGALIVAVLGAGVIWAVRRQRLTREPARAEQGL